MHPADEFARLRREIRALEARAQALRTSFLQGDVPRASNAHVVEIKEQKRRVFRRDALPKAILKDPSYWQTRAVPVVTVTPRSGV